MGKPSLPGTLPSFAVQSAVLERRLTGAALASAVWVDAYRSAYYIPSKNPPPPPPYYSLGRCVQGLTSRVEQPRAAPPQLSHRDLHAPMSLVFTQSGSAGTDQGSRRRPRLGRRSSHLPFQTPLLLLHSQLLLFRSSFIGAQIIRRLPFLSQRLRPSVPAWHYFVHCDSTSTTSQTPSAC